MLLLRPAAEQRRNRGPLDRGRVKASSPRGPMSPCARRPEHRRPRRCPAKRPRRKQLHKSLREHHCHPNERTTSRLTETSTLLSARERRDRGASEAHTRRARGTREARGTRREGGTRASHSTGTAGQEFIAARGYIARWLERLTADHQVPGSNPGGARIRRHAPKSCGSRLGFAWLVKGP